MIARIISVPQNLFFIKTPDFFQISIICRN